MSGFKNIEWSPEKYVEAAVLARLASEEMLARLSWMTLKPNVIVDMGCGAGVSSLALQARYPQATVIALDNSDKMLAYAKQQASASCYLQADSETLPFKNQSVDFIFANFLLPWQLDMKHLLQEWRRILRPNGLLMFTALGPDTFSEWQTVLPAVYALFPYAPPITQLIIQLKFQSKLCYAKTLGDCLAKQIQTVWYANQPLPDLIIPIPLHKKRLAERGFNQALEIARPIAKALALPIDKYGAKRHKYTVAQSHLTAQARKQNVSGAFSTSRDYRNLHLAVVDDVITTGHTLREFCTVLAMHGAKRIDVWCSARRG